MPQRKKKDDIANRFNVFLQNMRASTEQEFTSTANTWIACFISNVFLVEIYLELFKGNRRISKKRLQAAREKLERLNKYVITLRHYYPGRNTMPSDEIKEELFQELTQTAKLLNV